jgi:uncharacterized membrane protein HdeD (DUF308 family)
MRDYVQGVWWLIVLQGILLLLLGFFALAVPGLTLYVLSIGVAVYFLVAGIINVIRSLGGIGRLPLWFLSLLLGILEVGVGVYALKHPAITAATLILLVGAILVVRGIFEVISAYMDGYDGRNRSSLVILGVLSLVTGIVIWLYPASAGVAFSWILGVYGILGGSMLIALAIEARSLLPAAARY